MVIVLLIFVTQRVKYSKQALDQFVNSDVILWNKPISLPTADFQKI